MLNKININFNDDWVMNNLNSVLILFIFLILITQLI